MAWFCMRKTKGYLCEVSSYVTELKTNLQVATTACLKRQVLILQVFQAVCPVGTDPSEIDDEFQ